MDPSLSFLIAACSAQKWPSRSLVEGRQDPPDTNRSKVLDLFIGCNTHAGAVAKNVVILKPNTNSANLARKWGSNCTVLVIDQEQYNLIPRRLVVAFKLALALPAVLLQPWYLRRCSAVVLVVKTIQFTNRSGELVNVHYPRRRRRFIWNHGENTISRGFWHSAISGWSVGPTPLALAKRIARTRDHVSLKISLRSKLLVSLSHTTEDRRPEVATGIDNFAAKILEELGLTMTAIDHFCPTCTTDFCVMNDNEVLLPVNPGLKLSQRQLLRMWGVIELLDLLLLAALFVITMTGMNTIFYKITVTALINKEHFQQ
ncbi:hypothetical protein BJV77DRAFT_963611 [Russula vinacea]|nr:hypothetical protein BJV77DRAFT_963611 [Russula vinacea]